MREALALKRYDIVKMKSTGDMLKVVRVSKKRDPDTWNKYIEVVCKNKNKEFVFESHKNLTYCCSLEEYLVMKNMFSLEMSCG